MTNPINQDSPQYSTLVVGRNDRLYGLGSKQYRVYAANSSALPLLQIESTLDVTAYKAFADQSAVIENLVIDGQDYPNMIGILLDNVCKCKIENITIKNCTYGIWVNNTYGFWNECNLFKHIRMENVTTGMIFTTQGAGPDGYPGDSVGHTIIDDVNISLDSRVSSAVGIQIGGGTGCATSPNVKLYSALIRTNIAINNASGGTGLKIINGELKDGLVNLSVTGNGVGTGIDTTDSAISANQSFLLSTHGISTPISGLYSGIDSYSY